MMTFFREISPTRVWVASALPKGLTAQVDVVSRKLIVSGKIPLVDDEEDMPYTFKLTIAWED
jgi:hypothetical protein